jgi:hypothetical protein
MKPLPCACYKGRLHKTLNDVATVYLAEEINKIIASNRGISLEDAKKVRKVTKKECKAILVDFGELDAN